MQVTWPKVARLQYEVFCACLALTNNPAWLVLTNNPFDKMIIPIDQTHICDNKKVLTGGNYT